MSEFKGTKGKWVNHFNGNYHEIIRSSDFTDGKALSVNIMLFDSSVSPVIDITESIESKANALLISKAPEMLGMLEKISAFIDANENINYKIRLLSNEVPNIKQLIKEATEL